MNFWKAYKDGFFQFWKHRGLWFQYYAINLILALLATFSVFQYMNGQFGESIALEGALEIYDFRIITDILINYGSGISVLFDQSIALTFLFLLITAFLIGGIIKTYITEESRSDYWNNCAFYCKKILGLAFFFFLLQVVLFGIFLVVLNLIIPGISPDDIVSEVPVLNTLKLLSIPYLVIVLLTSSVHDYAKVFLIKEQSKGISIFKSIKAGTQFCCSNIFQTTSLLLLNLSLLIIVLLIYKIVETSILQDNTPMIIVAFILGQLSILFRIALKLWNLSSISKLCTL